MQRAVSIGWSVLLVVLAFGCNEAQPTINRVKPNVVEKSMFEGEWYSLQTVIDTPYSAGFTFVGEQGSMEKITWEIQEDFLIARRSYEFIAGSEDEGIAQGTEDNAPVAVYRIESHFDIRRPYSDVTGEEFNSVEENSRDCIWNQCKYMRVDWSENVAPYLDVFAFARALDGIQASPVSYFVQDLQEGHPHRPRFERWNGAKDVNYIDLVQKSYVEPQSHYYEGYGNIPACWFSFEDHLDCAPAEVTIRNSFLKVDPDRDYQPFEYTGDRMSRAGYFVTERAGYDPQYGTVEAARYRFANRHNIWQQSHQLTEAGETFNCTSDTHCGAGECDLDFGKAHRLTVTDEIASALNGAYPAGQYPEAQAVVGRVLGACTIPYREREVRPIAYHVSPGFPEDLLPDAEHFVAEWNDTFVQTVASLRETECLRTGGDEATCAAERAREDASEIFVLCHNPVLDTDNPACGGAGTSAQIGDLRYHLIGWVNEPHLYSPLGYGPSAADPETGEIIMANAFVYGAGVETLAAFARDIIALLNDDLAQGDLTSGQYITDWVKSLKAPGSAQTGRPMDDHAVKVDGSNVSRINQAMNFWWSRKLGTGGTLANAPRTAGERIERFRTVRDQLFRNGAFGDGTGGSLKRLDAVKGTDIEQMLTTPEMILGAGVNPLEVQELDENVLDRASPLRGMNPARRRALQRFRDKLQEKACVLNADFADDGLLGLARAIVAAAQNGGTMEWYGESYSLVNDAGELDYDLVRKVLRHPIFNAVTAHEVGHTLGLRHNFSGSYDAWNYHPEYWQLRDDGNMAPRYLDAVTPAEIDGRIAEYQYTTVMDYGNNFVVTDANGVGHYDYAAIKLGYGDLVEVFDGLDNTQAQTVAGLAITQTLGWPIPINMLSNAAEPEAYAYTDFPSLVGGIAGLEQRRDVRYTDVEPYAPLIQYGIDDRLFDKQGRPTVPYLFCSDETADLNPDCLRYDAGADAYEALQSVMDNYYNYYIFNAFGRGRIGYSPYAYFDRVVNRYFGKMQSATQIYGLFRPIFTDVWGIADGADFWTRPDGMGAWTAGVGASYQLLTQVVATPEPGDYVVDQRPDGSTALLPGAGFGGADLTIDEFEGRSLETAWNFDLGYFWFDQIERTGYFFDKYAALWTLVDPTTNFVGRDTSADVRRYAISYYTTFRDSMSSFLRGLQGEDWGTFAPRGKDEGGLRFPDALSITRRDTAGTPIDPNASFSIQLYAGVLSLALIPETYDDRYVQSARVFVKGGPNGVDLAPGTDTVEFADPDTGVTYVAPSYPAFGLETGVGAQMIAHANALKSRGRWAELRQFVGNLDLMHRLGWYFTFGN